MSPFRCDDVITVSDFHLLLKICRRTCSNQLKLNKMARVGPPGCCTGLHGPETSHASEFAASAAAAAPEGGGDSAGAEGGSGRKFPRSTLHCGCRKLDTEPLGSLGTLRVVGLVVVCVVVCV